MATQVETTPSRAIPTGRNSPSRRSQSQRKPKPWQSRRYPSARRGQHLAPDHETDSLSRQMSQRSSASTRRQPQWWKVRLFRGMNDDIKRRVPYYWSDWKDAWDYRVVPATIYMYFAKYDPVSPFLLSFSAVVFCATLLLLPVSRSPPNQPIFSSVLRTCWNLENH